ncbi:MAG: hypothetical protein ABEJ87_02980 [Candidatus Nanohalobium sp.]
MERKEHKWEIDHYLEEGLYLEEEEIIEQRVPFGNKVVEIMNSEADKETVEELEQIWQEYNDSLNSRVDYEPDYADAYNNIKGLDYSAEDIREFALAHTEFRDEASSRQEQRMGLMLSALMNSSDEDVFALPGYWSLAYRNNGNHVFVEEEAPWIGHEMEGGTLSVPYGAQLGIEPEGTEYRTVDRGYLEITEARTQKLQDPQEKA